MAKGKLVVITGPSGVGKSSIMHEVLRRTGAAFSISATTRAPRPGERDGQEYLFVDDETFDRMIRNEELLEWAEVFGARYGTPAAPVRRAVAEGKTVLLEIDVQGGLQVYRKVPDASFVLILPPSPDELARRLGGRGTEGAEAAAARLAEADNEIRTARQSGVYNHCVVNDDLAAAVRQVVRIVEQESANA
jgi:guanylate kinase